jgi:hypothetical protein
MVDFFQASRRRSRRLVKSHWASISCAAALVLASTTASAQQCSDCDCYHFPIPKKCENCCGVATGNIASATNSNLVLSQKEPNGETTKKTFGLKPNTRKNAPLKVGTPATVYYRKNSSEAVRVDLVEALKNLLLPGNEPDPPLPPSCPNIPPNALKAFLGDSLVYTTTAEAGIVKIKGIDLLDLRRTSSGIAILAKVFSEDGKVVAQIVDNRLYVNPGNFLRIDNPDSHSFAVYDLHQREVLAVRYMNLQSVRVLGIFQLPESPPVVISQNEILWGAMSFSDVCEQGDNLFVFQ